MIQDLSYLPEACIEEVAQYLSLDDVFACSGVSRGWRSAFDKDRVWRRYHTVHRDYFHRQQSQLGLSQEVWEGCEAKQHVFKEQLVRKNILRGRHSSSHFEVGERHRICCGTDTVDKDGNHLLFLAVTAENKHYFPVCSVELQIWKLDQEPVLVKIKRLVSFVKKPERIEANDGKLFYLYEYNALVFEFSVAENRFNFLYNVEIPEITDEVDRKKKQRFVCTQKNDLVFFHSNFFMVQLTSPFVCVWDQTGGLSHISDPSFETIRQKRSDPHLEVKYNHNSADIIAVLTKWKENSNFTCLKLELFNLSNFQYIHIKSKNNVQGYHFGLFNNRILLLLKSDNVTKIKLFNFEGIEMQKTAFESFTWSDFRYFQGRREIVLVESDGSSVVVLDVSRQLKIFRLNTKDAGYKYSVINTVSLKNNALALLACERKPVTVYFDLWNYNTGQMLARNKLSPDIMSWLSYGCPIRSWCAFHYSQHKDEYLPKVMAIEEGSTKVLVASFW